MKGCIIGGRGRTVITLTLSTINKNVNEANGNMTWFYDLNLPGIDGGRLLRRTHRQALEELGALILSARLWVCDRIVGLDAGAVFTYKTAFGELGARIRTSCAMRLYAWRKRL